MDLYKELETAKKAALEAGAAILGIYKESFEIKYKEDDSPLTIADEEANNIIMNILKSAFPQYAILSEEAKDDPARRESDWCWIVDPLDGTKEFIKGNGEFTVNIALTYRQKPVLGVIYIPVKEEFYYAIKNQGAYFEKNNNSQRIYVSDRVENIRAACSRSHSSEKLVKLLTESGVKEFIYAGSALKGCMIAKGEAEIYYRYGLTCEWDTAAIHCIVEEAGGIFRQMDDSEMLYNREDTVNRKGFYILNRIENKIQLIDNRELKTDK
ncbi:MAG: 3'(2'),5'-bisphosphate nucleotidase CysQ [Clostridiales bacterium]|nr:3'(2'),5'-bisphosphate nucleotidase CysQ [Clostridiales bacterium]